MRRIDLHADNVPFNPVRLDGKRMPLRLERSLHLIRNPSFDPEQTGFGGMGIDLTGEVPTAEFGRLDSLLQWHTEVYHIEEKL